MKLFFTSNIIRNDFNKSGIINKYHTTKEEDTFVGLYLYDLNSEDHIEVIVDLSIELEINDE